MGILGESGLDQSDAMKEAIAMYAAMDQSRCKIGELQLAGKVWQHEQVRFFRLENNVNKLWKNLTRTEEIQAAEILVEMRMMSPTVLTMLKLTGGKIEAL